MKQHLLTEIPEFVEMPIFAAFTGHVMSANLGVEDASKMICFELKQKFGAQKIKYAFIFEDRNQGRIAELYIVTSDDEENGLSYPLAMITRMWSDGLMQQSSISFTQYEYRPYNSNGVVSMIRNLPHPHEMIKLGEAFSPCACSEGHH